MADTAEQPQLDAMEAKPPASEAVEEPASKKARAEDASDEAPSDAPATAQEAAEEAAQGNTDDAQPTEEDADAKPKAVETKPVTIGYKTFANGSDCYKYFHNIVSKYRKNQNLNEYEFHMVHELIRTGHPEADRKMAPGVSYIQIRSIFSNGFESSCFYLIRPNGAAEDVSYRKCISTLFPEMREQLAAKTRTGGGQGGRSGQQGGRGRGGRGRGGPRGRGRGGRGRR